MTQAVPADQLQRLGTATCHLDPPFAVVDLASLAPLISVHLGQPVTLLCGFLCYLAALAIALRWARGGTEGYFRGVEFVRAPADDVISRCAFSCAAKGPQ